MLRIHRVFICLIFLCSAFVYGQDKEVLIPKPVEGSPYSLQDDGDLFGQAFRWFFEGEVERGSDKLKELLSKAGIKLLPENYYVVVAHFTDDFCPIGLFYGSSHFLSTRMFGLKSDNLFYIFISRRKNASSYISVMATSKASPFQENLLPFLSLFIPNIPVTGAISLAETGLTTYVDIRQFNIPESFRKNSDLSFLVKKDLSDEKILARAVFDNTSKERFSYGIATAITSVNDLDILIGDNGRIIVKPKPNLDLATFAVINYHFKAVDTRAKTFENSFHLMAGIRLVDYIEPIAGVGAGFDLGFFDLALFAGYSVEFANELKDGFVVGQNIGSADPFKIKLRGKPRFGIQIKFP